MPFVFYRLVLVPGEVDEAGMPVYRMAPYVTIYDEMVEIALSPGQSAALRAGAPTA